MSPLRDVPTEERAAIEDARVAFNQKRVVILGAGMALVHVLAFTYFTWLVVAKNASQVVWRQNLQIVHVTSFLVVLLLVALGRRAISPRWLGELFTFAYMLYGASVSLNSQSIGRSIDVFLVAVIALAFGIRLHAASWTLASGLGLALLLGAMAVVQPDATARVSVVANAVPVAVVAWVVSRMQMGTFTRDFLQARLIERQRDELGRLNEVLDAQLRDKLVDRSRELARALEAIGRDNHPAELGPGTELAERFVIERTIGRGGMGTVYRSRDRLLGRPVAVKMMTLAVDTNALKRFLREVEVMAAIEHPAIVRSLHVDVSEGGRLFHVQELVVGEALDSISRRAGALPSGHVARIGAVLAGALAVAHARGVVHRDVKPGNVMLTAVAPGLKLLDFGISKLTRTARATNETRPGVVVGTPAFMAPEQLLAPDETSEPADVFALGATLRALLTGRPPRRGEDAGEGAPSLLALVRMCLDPNPTGRPSAEHLHEQLHAVATSLRADDLATCNRALLEERQVREATAVTVDSAGRASA